METSNRIALQIENIQVLTTLKPFLAGFVLAVFFLESNAVECDIYILIRDFHIVIPLDPFWKRLVALRREYRFSTGAVENGMKPGFQIVDFNHFAQLGRENQRSALRIIIHETTPGLRQRHRILPFSLIFGRDRSHAADNPSVHPDFMKTVFTGVVVNQKAIGCLTEIKCT